MATMGRPGFRRASVGGGGRLGTAEGTTRAAFSQAQILQLMRGEFARARRHGYALACVVIEADRLLALADIHGAELRDTVQRQLGRLLLAKTRGHDHVGSIGEDRYVLVLPHTAASEAMVVAERIRSAFGELAVEASGSPLPLTLSLGVAACVDGEALFFDTLVSQAEVALEWAMRDGGDQCVQFDRERFATPASDD
jgi:diguanylate cyclase (GGDEF)-like protein